MYRMLYNDSFLFDPFDETRIVSSASITTNVNAASYLDFTIAANHPLYNVIEHQSGTVTLYSNKEKLFQGLITDISIDMDGNKSVTCASALNWLKDVQLRPYSTDQNECNEYEFKLDKAPDSLDAYFQWLIDQYNAQNRDGRRFVIKVNQANDLTRENTVYFASTSPQSVADALEQNIINNYGGYLALRYEDDELILDLYSDIHEMNEQIIDYGENILDITRDENTEDQYTAVYPLGKTPQYTAEQQKYHDEKDAYDARMKQRDEAEKAAIDKLKKEEDAEQNRINGITDKNAKKAAQDALKRRKDQRQAREKAFSDETKRLQDEQKVKDDKNSADKTKPNPITIESLNDGGYEGDLDIFKQGDVVFSTSYVERYGYKEYVYSETDIDDKNTLLKLAVAKLKTLMAPSLTIDVRAVDQALYNPKHTHLFAGQAVRVRSKPHGVDEFMMVSSIDLDLIDPSRTTATLGVAYDTLTGQQSSFLRNLNSQIVASVDAVDKLGEDVKVTEITLGRVETAVDNVAADNELIVNTVGDYKWMTDTAWGKAEDAQESADEANQGVADTNVRIDNIKMETDERIDDMETDISGIHDGINDAKAEIVTIKENAEQIRQDAQAGIDEAKQQAEDIRTEANTAISNVRTDLAATEAKAEQARQHASSALGGLSSAQAQINDLRNDVNRHQENITNIDGEIVGVKDTISGVSETANSALTVATTNTQAINEQSTRIDTAYADIEATRTSVSEVKQTADGLKVNLETNYLDKDALGENYASKAELNATSESITATVEKTYATKSALEGLQNIADAAIETWSGRAVPTASNAPASTWTTDALKRQHSGDIYYDMSTGKSYRWGSEDGATYSWSMIADNDITKAIADAAKAQQTADGAKQDVVNLSNDVKATYTSKSEFKQTSDEIRASVNEVASVNETNTRKIAEVSVKADGIGAKVEEQAETISGHTTSIGQLALKADGLQTKFEQVSSDVDHINKSISGLINPNFEDGTYGWLTAGANFRISTHDASLGGPYLVAENFTQNGAYKLLNTGLLSLTPGHTYRVSMLAKINTGVLKTDEGITIRFVRYADLDDYNTYAYANITRSDVVDGEFITYSRDLVCPEKITQAYLRIAAETNANNGYIIIKNISIIDVTESSQALKKTAELEANLDGFKSTVSETYTTKDEFNNLDIGGTNLLLGTKNSTTITGNSGSNQVRDLHTLVVPSWADLESGDYTFSMDISYEGTIGGQMGLMRNGGPWGFQPQITKRFEDIFTDDKRTAHLEFTRSHINAGTTNRLSVRFDNVPGTVTYSRIKLERGNRAADWSPAPEDMLDTATAATTYTTKTEFNQTKNAITARVEENAESIAGHTTSIGQLQVKSDEISSKVDGVTETANTALTQSTTAIQNLNGFKQTVEATYATKTQLSDEMKQSLKTTELRGRMDGNYWFKLGRLTMEQQGRDFHIDYTGGRGYEGATYQNSQLEIHVRSSNGSGTLFGVTVNRLLNADMYRVKAFAIDATHIDLYIKSDHQYSTGTMAYYGQYSDFSGAKQIDDISTAEGTELTVFEQSLSSKTYVDQTANSVAIGVVEDYKNGKHGDKLTTSADITVLKEEINQTVQKNYADISEKIELKGSENVVQNPSFEVADFAGWEKHDNWYYGATNGGHTGQNYVVEPINPNADGDELINSGSIKVEFGHTYRVSFWAKSDLADGVYAYLRYQRKINGAWETSMYSLTADMIAVGKDWKQIAFDIEPEQKASEIRVRIIGRNNSSSGVAYFAVDDVSLTDYSVAKTINTTMSQIDQKADSISQTVTNNYASLNAAIGAVGKRITGLENPNFDAIEEGSDRLTGWTANGPWARANLSGYSPVQAGSGTYFAGVTSGVADRAISLINDGYITTYPGMKLQIALWAWIDDNVINNNAISIGVIQQNDAITRELVTAETNSWKQYSTTVEIPNNVDRVRVRIGFTTTSRAAAIRLDSVSVADVTTANVALGKATTAIQDLEGFRQTVSNTYATKDTVNSMQTEWKQTAKGFEASIKESEQAISAVGSGVAIINPGFETGDATGWKSSGFTSTSVANGSIYSNTTYRFTGITGSTTGVLENDGRVSAKVGDYIKVTARILALNNNVVVNCPCRIGFRSRNGVPYFKSMNVLNTGWNVIESTIQVATEGLHGFYLDFQGASANLKVLVDDVTMENDTTAVALRTDLETRIAMTSNGVRVGKVVNGAFEGTSALLNSEGSFDILQGEEAVATLRSDYVGLMRNSDTNKYRFGVRPYKEHSTGSVDYTYEGVDLQTVGGFSLNGIPAAPASDILAIRPTQMTGNNYFIKYNVEALKNDNAIFINAATLHREYYQRLNEGKPALAVHFKHAVGMTTTKDGDLEVSNNDHVDTQVIALNPCLYGIQFVVNAQKNTVNTYLDATVKVMKTGESTWINSSALPAFRVIEQGDPIGWLTRTSPMYFVKLDVGYRFGIYISGSSNDFKIGTLNKLIITRMPFSGERMD